MWIDGKLKGFYYQVKYYDEGSSYGIDEGRISKLWIEKDGRTFAHYDRGWDITLDDADAWEVYERLLEQYN